MFPLGQSGNTDGKTTEVDEEEETAEPPAPAPAPTPASKKTSTAPKKPGQTPKTKKTKATDPLSSPLPGFPSELAENDEIPLLLPHHQFEWKDEHHDKHITIMILLPTGTDQNALEPRVESGGQEVTVEYTWSNVMLNSRIAMLMGSTDPKKPFYPIGHVKVAQFRESVKNLKRGDETFKQIKLSLVDLL